MENVNGKGDRRAFYFALALDAAAFLGALFIWGIAVAVGMTLGLSLGIMAERQAQLEGRR